MAASLIIRDRLPAVDSRYISQMGIQELVASGTTYFAGSSPARVHNIEVAAEKFEGVVIPPNGIFSFNKVVEDVTGANGFEDSLIIWGDRTAVGVGGGVCQVSTTVFRAAYAAGLPIVERYNHGYVVSWYGEPGLDATIYTPSVDFRFRNDTGSYLLLEPVVDGTGGTITFNLYGTKPDRVVTIGEPVITDIVEPEPAIYRYDETLGYGEKEQVDWEQNGMTSKVTRTILENGETRSETLTSVYQPWRAVYLYGPGVDVPATPTASPRSDATGNGEGGIALPTPTSQPNASEAESVSAEASPGDSASSESTSTP
jgi:vancomycin resistance protein YoaR